MLMAGLEHSATDETVANGLGFISSDKWTETVSVTRTALELGEVPDDLFTPEFLPGPGG
jgi:hypothetical protein